MEIFVLTVAGVAGLVVGSFLNVVIWRLPRGEMMGRKRSHCPSCDAMIRWYDNLPVVSWLFLRGRCRQCTARISARYPLVEALTGVLFVLAAHENLEDLATAGIVAAFLAALVAISFIDLDHRIIPDKITKPGMLVFVALAPLSALAARDLVPGKPVLSAWLSAGLGVLVGAGVVFTIRAVGSFLLKKEAMGLGDVKLMGLIGGVVGWLHALYALGLGCFAGAIIGGVMFAVGKRRPIRCELRARAKDLDASFDRVRVRDDRVEVRGAPAVEPGTAVRLHVVLPAAKILEDADAELDLRATVARSAGDVLTLEVREASETDRERLAFFAMSYRYIPFGPFLAIGGALSALFGTHVHWFMTKGWPEFIRSLVAGGT
jgi:leader peptidase (prepilin peptidase)/N-methyltransferase